MEQLAWRKKTSPRIAPSKHGSPSNDVKLPLRSQAHLLVEAAGQRRTCLFMSRVRRSAGTCFPHLWQGSHRVFDSSPSEHERGELGGFWSCKQRARSP